MPPFQAIYSHALRQNDSNFYHRRFILSARTSLEQDHSECTLLSGLFSSMC